MKPLPELSPSAEEHIKNIRIVAQARVRRGRRKVEHMRRRLYSGNAEGIFDHGSPIEDAEKDVQVAAAELFDAYAEHVWHVVRPDLSRFTAMLEDIGVRVSREIVYQEFRNTIRDTSNDKILDWVQRAATDATEVSPQVEKSAPRRGPVTERAVSPQSIIDDFRTKQGWSLDQLAEKAGIDRRQVFKVRAGRNVRPYVLKALAEIMGVEPSVLAACGNSRENM